MGQRKVALPLLIFFLTFLYPYNDIHAGEKGALKSAAEHHYPPFCIVTPDGAADGFSVELLNAALEAVELDVEFKVGSWTEVKNALARGEIQVLPLVGRTPERETVYDFTFTYLTLHGAIFVRKGNSEIDSLDDLADKEIIVMKGDNAEEFVLREKISPHVISVDTYKHAMEMLASGKHDAVIAQRLMGISLLHKLGIKDIVPLKYQLLNFKQHFSFAVKEGDNELLATLNEGLSIVMADGTYEKLYQKWIVPVVGKRLTFKDIRKYLISGLILFLIALTSLFYREIRQKQEKLLREIEAKNKIESLAAKLSSESEARKKASEKIEKQGMFLENILESLTHPLCVIDTNSLELVLVNSAAHAEGAIVGAKCYKAFHDKATPCWETGTMCPIDEVKKRKKMVTVEHEHFDGKGRKKWLEVHAYPLFNSSGELSKIIEYSLNITERKKAEIEMKLAKEEADKASRAKSQFLANMSHEIRTPMNSVVGYANLLKKTRLDKQQLEHIEIIEKSASLLVTLLSDILDLTVIEDGRITFNMENINLVKLIQGVVEMVKAKADQKNIKIIYQYDPEIPKNLPGDPKRLQQIGLNLLNNALKFTEEGSIKVSLKLNESDKSINLIVKDTGLGINASLQEAIFNPFMQADMSSTKKHEGAGLGLYITKRTLDVIGGTIGVSSVVGKGSEFTVSIPIEDYDNIIKRKDTRPVKTKTPPAETYNSLSNIKILVVEDDTTNSLLMCTILERWGVITDTAYNGEEAIEKVKENSYKLVLMDVKMPVLDGIEATKTIRNEISTDLPIIAVTAFALPEDQKKCFDAGMNDFCPKPVEMAVLKEKITKLVKAEAQQSY